MIKGSLHAFVERVAEGKHITEDDVRMLQRSILVDGIASRDEADVLIALDRAVATAHPAWAAYLTGAVVEFVVWTSRPTGLVDRDTARWLTASLGCGKGPTETAVQIAFQIVMEAERVDEILVAFTLRVMGRGCSEADNPSAFERFAA